MKIPPNLPYILNLPEQPKSTQINPNQPRSTLIGMQTEAEYHIRHTHSETKTDRKWEGPVNLGQVFKNLIRKLILSYSKKMWASPVVMSVLRGVQPCLTTRRV